MTTRNQEQTGIGNVTAGKCKNTSLNQDVVAAASCQRPTRKFAARKFGLLISFLVLTGGCLLGLPTKVQALESVANVTALRALNSVPSSTIYLEGYYSARDGGEGMLSVDLADTTSPDDGGMVFVSSDNKRWKRSAPSGAINVRWFGARGNNTTDDTAAIQAAINFVRISINSGYGNTPATRCRKVYIPFGLYLITQSLDCTGNDNMYEGFTIEGEMGYRSTLIKARLTEAYPVFDYTGATYGVLKGITVEGCNGDNDATCAFFAAKSSSAHGNCVTVQDCTFMMGSNCVSSVVLRNVDLSKVEDCRLMGTPQSGLWAGLSLPPGVTSKYQALSAQTDSTMFYVNGCIIHGTTGPVVCYTGGSEFSIRDCYLALTGSGTGEACIRVTGNDFNGNGVYAYNVRTENQSASSGYFPFQFLTNSRYGVIIGALTVSPGGMDECAIYVDSEHRLNGYRITNGGTSSAPMFGGGGTVNECNVLSLTRSWGTNPGSNNYFNNTHRP